LFSGLEPIIIAYRIVEHLFTEGFSIKYFYHIARTVWEVALGERLFRYAGHANLLIWSPQYGIACWLATSAILHEILVAKRIKFIGFIICLCALWTPMVTVGYSYWLFPL
jgi:hypothetical protein